MKDKDTLLLEDMYSSIQSGYSSPSPTEVLGLIKSLPDADKHIFMDNGMWNVTNEWLAGGFAGRSFEGNTPEKAAHSLIEYFNGHIGHNSIVGREVTKSGWPDLNKVRAYLTPIETEEIEDI